MNVRHPSGLLWVSLVFVTCAGCGSLSPGPPAPEPQAHELAPVVPAKNAAHAGGPSLFVSTVRAHGPYSTNLMAYRQRPFELDYFSKNVWAAEPAALIEPWLWQSLEASGLFGSVVSGVGAPPTRYRLDTVLIVLRHEFDAEPSQVRLVLRLSLIDLEARSLVDSMRLELTEPASSRDAYGGVVATNRLVTAALRRINEFCASAIGAR